MMGGRSHASPHASPHDGGTIQIVPPSGSAIRIVPSRRPTLSSGPTHIIFRTASRASWNEEGCHHRPTASPRMTAFAQTCRTIPCRRMALAASRPWPDHHRLRPTPTPPVRVEGPFPFSESYQAVARWHALPMTTNAAPPCEFSPPQIRFGGSVEGGAPPAAQAPPDACGGRGRLADSGRNRGRSPPPSPPPLRQEQVGPADMGNGGLATRRPAVWGTDGSWGGAIRFTGNPLPPVPSNSAHTAGVF